MKIQVAFNGKETKALKSLMSTLKKEIPEAKKDLEIKNEFHTSKYGYTKTEVGYTIFMKGEVKTGVIIAYCDVMKKHVALIVASAKAFAGAAKAFLMAYKAAIKDLENEVNKALKD